MHENLAPLSWSDIAAKNAPEELPFLRYFEELDIPEPTQHNERS